MPNINLLSDDEFNRRFGAAVIAIMSGELMFNDSGITEAPSAAPNVVDIHDHMSLRQENVVLTNIVKIQKLTIKALRLEERSSDISSPDLLDIIDKTRKKNGTINYSAVARRLGVHHTTVKTLLVRRGIKSS